MTLTVFTSVLKAVLSSPMNFGDGQVGWPDSEFDPAGLSLIADSNSIICSRMTTRFRRQNYFFRKD